MNEWQPIETCPKDGEEILLIKSSGEVKVGTFHDSGDGYPWVVFDFAVRDHLNGWSDGKYGPTHWMPLPEPPR